MTYAACSQNITGVLSIVHTGEEHEDTLHQVRAKLYTMDTHDTYKEKGTGTLKLNVRKEDGKGARIGTYLSSHGQLPLHRIEV